MTCSLLLFADMPGRCLYCGDVLPKYRRKWCDDECSLLVATNHVWVLAKAAVYKRDQGKCQMCGCQVYRSAESIIHPGKPRYEDYRGDWRGYDLALADFHRTLLPFMGEVNHIEPRNGGGYNSGCHNHLDKLELLCHQCHVGVTNQQATTRASLMGVD